MSVSVFKIKANYITFAYTTDQLHTSHCNTTPHQSQLRSNQWDY